ncbi:cytochrome-c oxidase, cbb3-type subunit III [Niveispirillum fermenti]|uniref:cytochrome-c oxidase, cbb3-type subunit III n=1 Tax=Niveispirillum fermenti TaxID=1233113 RepID=UPI003A8A49F8
MPSKIEKDATTGTETTGHEWDGIKELNTPLPKWWLYTFYATIVWGLAYTLVFPSWPSLTGHFEGTSGWTRRAEVADTLAAQKEAQAGTREQILALDIESIRRDPALMGYVQAAGRVAFADNCAGCHGAGGAGAVGFPTLADDDWIWGGTPDQILQTITYGIRNANDNSRFADMPRFGADGILTKEQIADTADFVLSLSGNGGDAAAIGRGAAIYADNCAACHGERGEGMHEVGAPRLSDGIWLYGGDRPTVIESITNARRGSMPAWIERLDPATVKVLATYVHALGGGQ